MSLGFSIIVCCYDSEQRITETLISLSNLIVPDQYSVELIIVDNNSSDNTLEKASSVWEGLGSKFPIKIVSEPKQGLINARVKE